MSMPYIVYPELGLKYGIVESIILMDINTHIEQYEYEEDEDMFSNDCYWYATVISEWATRLGCGATEQVQEAINNLVENGHIIVKDFKPESIHNKSLWYTTTGNQA